VSILLVLRVEIFNSYLVRD